MSFADAEGPPAKKRRFFTEKSDLLNSSLAQEPSLPDEFDALSSGALDDEYLERSVIQNGSSASERSARDEAPIGFDQDMFESFVGDKVPPEVMKQLREASGDNLERAVNMFFDGSWKAALSKSSSSLNSRAMSINAFARPETKGANGNHAASPRPASPQTQQSLRNSMPEYRYVGAFGVGAWATRSGNTLIKHGEPVRIERQKIQPPKAPVGKGKGRPAATQFPKPGSAAAKRVDVIVRFTNSRGDEIGRLPRECANWVST